MDFFIGNYSQEYQNELNKLAITAFSEYKERYEDWTGFQKRISNMAKFAEKSEIIIAIEKQVLVGAVVYVASGLPKSEFFPADWAILRMLVVKPEERGRGIGKELSIEGINRAKRDNAPFIGLHTSSIMESAIHLYSQLGFNKVKDVPDIHGVPYAIYAKRLD